MSRLIPSLALVAAAICTGLPRAAAQALDFSPATEPAEPRDGGTPSATPAALAARPAAKPQAAAAAPAPAASERREISSETAARLSDGMARFDPSKQDKPVLNQPKPAVDDASAADARKNGIIRLPDYVVSEKPPPVFQQREILTKDEIARMMFKKNPGLNLFGFMPFASLNAPIALQMFDEEERLQNIADLRDSAITIRRGGDAGEGDFIKKQTQQTFKHDVWGSNDQEDGR
jgi:hypothetical protein